MQRKPDMVVSFRHAPFRLLCAKPSRTELDLTDMHGTSAPLSGVCGPFARHKGPRRTNARPALGLGAATPANFIGSLPIRCRSLNSPVDVLMRQAVKWL